ncbi:MAG: DNA cytosine methyltransferase, partial [Anaerolineae bacterium]|nr:DNA cytosine methyltransferase [Anaerolineae bacterium]
MSPKTSYISVTDQFCGAGGSTTGAKLVPGVEVVLAMNHWQLAIETHNTNHPGTEHVLADIS